MKKAQDKKLFIFMGIIFLISVVGILIGTFLDEQISTAVVDSHSVFNAFVETIGASLGYLSLSMGGTLIFLALYKNEKIYIKIIGWFFLVLGLFLSTFFLGKSFVKGSFYKEFIIPGFWGYFVAFVLMFGLSSLTYALTKTDDKVNLIKVGLIMMLAMGLQYGLMELLKNVGCRPRFRFLIDEDLNNVHFVYRPWYMFEPFSKHGDYFKSWPSGHTATAAQVMLLALWAPLTKFKFKNEDVVFFIAGLTYTLLIATSRVLYGAHFLSDVSFGLLIGSLCALAMYFLVDFVSEKIVNKIGYNKRVEDNIELQQ